MNISRRTILKSAAIGAATAIGSAVTRAPALAESDTVKVASLHDLSGAVDVYGIKPLAGNRRLSCSLSRFSRQRRGPYRLREIRSWLQ
jgi:hypothetical protein